MPKLYSILTAGASYPWSFFLLFFLSFFPGILTLAYQAMRAFTWTGRCCAARLGTVILFSENYPSPRYSKYLFLVLVGLHNTVYFFNQLQSFRIFEIDSFSLFFSFLSLFTEINVSIGIFFSIAYYYSLFSMSFMCQIFNHECTHQQYLLKRMIIS